MASGKGLLTETDVVAFQKCHQDTVTKLKEHVAFQKQCTKVMEQVHGAKQERAASEQREFTGSRVHSCVDATEPRGRGNIPRDSLTITKTKEQMVDASKMWKRTEGRRRGAEVVDIVHPDLPK